MTGERNQVSFSCPSCGELVSASLKYVGLRMECPACQEAIAVPQPGGRGGAEALEGGSADGAQGEEPAPPSGGAAQSVGMESGASGRRRRRWRVWTMLAVAALLLATFLLWRGCPRRAAHEPNGAASNGDADEGPDSGDAEAGEAAGEDPPVEGEAPFSEADGPDGPDAVGGEGELGRRGWDDARGGVGGRPREEAPADEPPPADEAMAWEQAKRAVRQRLKVPDKAEFPPLGGPGVSVERRGDRCTVHGAVAAPDEFGRVVRVPFQCELQWLPGVEAWRVLSVEFLGAE